MVLHLFSTLFFVFPEVDIIIVNMSGCRRESFSCQNLSFGKWQRKANADVQAYGYRV